MKYFLPLCFAAAVVICVLLFLKPAWFFRYEGDKTPIAKIITPQVEIAKNNESDEAVMERRAYEDANLPKIAPGNGEITVAVLTANMDEDPLEEQVIAYRIADGEDSAIHISYIDFNDEKGLYERVWADKSSATRPRTFSLYAKDLVGDRSVCVIAGGMNDEGEQTMTVFRKAVNTAYGASLSKIADLHTDGSIVVSESERSQAYHLGLTEGDSFNIATYGRDFESGNLLDQIETVYSYDPASGRYERMGVSRIPGIQIEQRRVRELLSGTPANFERFLDGLWTFSPSAGQSAAQRFLHFDPNRREVIFYSDDTQEVYSWQNSSATRYGLYITTQNVSVTTLRRLIDIELASIDTIKLKVFEDVRLKIGVGGLWDGSYKKLSPRLSEQRPETIKGRINARYEGSLGVLVFNESGEYSLTSNAGSQNGLYAFYTLLDHEYLELRPLTGASERTSYELHREKTEASGELIILRAVKLGASGVTELLEAEARFTRIEETPPNPAP